MRLDTRGRPYRGSRKHVLDWTGTPAFPGELQELLAPAEVRLLPDSPFLPRGYGSPDEARLERSGAKLLPGSTVWPTLRDWWLAHSSGANTPNWDIAAGCLIEDRPGLVLVEAKANWPELGRGGKRLAASASLRASENHERIGAAVGEACRAWQLIDGDVRLDYTRHYQLANRLAFTWKLAELGIPVALLYLGFTGDDGIRDAGRPFADDADWRAAFSSYAAAVGTRQLFECRHEFSGTPAWLLVRSRSVLEVSPTREACRQVLAQY